MQDHSSSSFSVQDALRQGVLQRLPLTFLPFVNQQLREWDSLFPNERRSVERLLLFVSSLTPPQSVELFREVVQLEDRMGVRQWQFSTSEQTIENSSHLARSPWFPEWRRAVQAVFNAADQHALTSGPHRSRAAHQLIFIDLPAALPVDPARAWRRWQSTGRVVRLAPKAADASGSLFDLLLADSTGILSAASRRGAASPGDTWIIDAGSGENLSPALSNSASFAPVLLSYQRLDLYRQNFSREMNTMRKDLADADAVYDRLRKVDVTPWCPPEIAADALIREFVRSLYLSGNGAVIFGNSFVEWAASEAFRRARPTFLAARFGVRSQPKPFTGVAVFENPDQVNPLPPVDDLQGSAIDAEMLALYIWLAALRYEEYRSSTVCLCVAEKAAQVMLVAPPGFSLPQEPLQGAELAASLHAWLA